MDDAEMKERPIIFSGPMVRAILAGEKTQTRRIVKPQAVKCPYGKPGDRLWVRESFCEVVDQYGSKRAHYRASEPNLEVIRPMKDRPPYAGPPKWKPSIHMPRWASRIDLEITHVRSQRLQAITVGAARAEGIVAQPGYLASEFKALWESIHGSGSWDKNPWVWVIEFEIESVKSDRLFLGL